MNKAVDQIGVICRIPAILPISYIDLFVTDFKTFTNGIVGSAPEIPEMSLSLYGRKNVRIEVFCSQGMLVFLPYLTAIDLRVDDPITTLLNATSLGKGLDSDECISVVSRWLQECAEQSSFGHPYCLKPEQYPMSSRVINVGPPDGSQEPRLQSTNGKLGYWAALSHC